MDILYDHQIFSLQVNGGISRYFYELIKNIKIEEQTSVCIKFSNNYYLKKVNENHMNFFPNFDFRGKHKFIELYNTYYTQKRLGSISYDIFHPTYYNTYFLKHIKKPFVVTVHDMIHEKFYRMFSKKDNTIAHKKELMEKANKIIAISENTKMDILDIYNNIDDSKIEVIYHGNSVSSSNLKLQKSQIPLPNIYILFVGGRATYKNFLPFVEAVTPILRKYKELKVLCIGGGKFNNQELSLFKRNVIESSFEQLNLNDEDLILAYKKAKFLIYPSLYEGFGMPILEAFECDCPVVCSNTSSFPEIAGDAAHFFNPYDKEDIHDSIKELLHDDQRLNDLVKKGRKRALLFSWEKTSQKTMEVYKSI
ncbi:mannosyltransferase [Capnocytophaga cynodegmi]|uniref:glycosyltransferase family 4 protein n=1 Tax=Capnocytophaga cynodegmi TaxID=28189 RepID=UPI001EE39F4D|nr:glycosyltransferase family 1 protein [Capnocytophaga cynodegmi]GJQ07395.1 mannosyltransferase [Capnocytophaga cynodegmi]